jgi:hypothetical protein
VKDAWVARACSDMKNTYKIVVERPEGKRPLEWEDNIKM